VVVVNGCEGEPSSAKDTVLLTHAPHQVLDGAALVAHAIGARRVIVALTDRTTAALVRRAVASRPDAAAFDVRTVEDRFVAGEARALVSALNGGPAVPPGRRIQPTERGVGGAPTLLSNAETFAQAGLAARLGTAYAAVGTPAEPGTTLLTVTGAVSRPGVVEVPYGTTLATIAEAAGAARSQAVVVGGYHGAWVSPDPQLVMSRAGLAAAGGALGAGAVMFVGENTCGLAELARVADWLAGESAKNCGPCAFGLPALAADVRALAGGQASPDLIARHARMVTGRGACAHPDGAARFVMSGLVALRRDVATHQAHGGCRRHDLGCLPTSRARAFIPAVSA
jgi:NADH:ubiquinone oxidoreductase subunit F (NADH-binding)